MTVFNLHCLESSACGGEVLVVPVDEEGVVEEAVPVGGARRVVVRANCECKEPDKKCF